MVSFLLSTQMRIQDREDALRALVQNHLKYPFEAKFWPDYTKNIQTPNAPFFSNPRFRETDVTNF